MLAGKIAAKIGVETCVEKIAQVLERVQPLDLPYSTRGYELSRVLNKRIINVEDCNLSLIAFRSKGLKDTIIVCLARRISVKFESAITVNDRLSGLPLRLKVPVLYIDECRIPFEWRRTVMMLTSDRLLSCSYCEKTSC